MGAREDIERIKTGITEAQAANEPWDDAYYMEQSITREEHEERTKAGSDRTAELTREREGIWFDRALSRDDLDVVVADIQELRDEMAKGLASKHARVRKVVTEKVEEYDRALRRVKLVRQERDLFGESAMERLRVAVSDGVLVEEELERLRPYLFGEPPQQ